MSKRAQRFVPHYQSGLTENSSDMTFTTILKMVLVRLPFFVTVVSYLTRWTPRIFMYHRFTDGADDSGTLINGKTFEWQLRRLDDRWNVISLGEYLRLRRSGEKRPPYLVVLTIDDGYADFYRVAYPRLRQRGMPATFFPTVGFVDGGWLWLDRIRYAFEVTRREVLSISLSGNDVVFDLKNGGRERACQTVSDHCLVVGEHDKFSVIARLEKELDVNVPAVPPNGYQAVNWDQLCEMSENQIEIGSHTMSHPILSRIPAKQLHSEIETSKAMIEGHIGRPVVSFCYPNGSPDDSNSEVCSAIEVAGYAGAVMAYDGPREPFEPYRIPRTGVGSDKTDFLWKLCGMEGFILAVKQRLKGSS